MTEISPKEFGKLQANYEYVKLTLDSHTKILESMDSKLDSLVTHQQLNDRLSPVEKQVSRHAERLVKLEDRQKIADASVWRKVGSVLESSFVKLLAAVFFGVMLAAMYFAVKNNLTNQPQIPAELIEKLK